MLERAWRFESSHPHQPFQGIDAVAASTTASARFPLVSVLMSVAPRVRRSTAYCRWASPRGAYRRVVSILWWPSRTWTVRSGTPAMMSRLETCAALEIHVLPTQPVLFPAPHSCVEGKLKLRLSFRV